MVKGLHLPPRHRKEIVALLHKHLPGVEVWAYGSRVNGQSHEGSDLDLALRGPRLAEIDTSRLADFIEALQDSTIPFLVEVRDWARLPTRFHHEIERAHVVLAEREERTAGSGWREFEFASLCDITRGASPRPIHEWTSERGIPWVKISDASNSSSRFIERTRKRIRSEGRTKSVSVVPGDLILSNSATPGIPMFISIEACIHDGWLLLRNFRDLDKLFCYYLLLYEKPRIVRQGTGTVFNNLKTEILKRHRVKVPPLHEQRAIAHILGTLDDKIELNRRMNETLESMARALFKSWFVDFDPVRAKMEGRDTGLPQDLADLFPDRLVDSELGKIPEGWEVKTLAETVEIIGGGTPKTSVPHYWDGDIPWFSVVDAPVQSDIWVVDTAKKATQRGIEDSSAQMLPVGTTIISARGTVGRIALVGVPMAMNQSCYGLRRNGQKNGLFNYFTIRALVVMLQQRTHGSVFDTITRDTLAAVYVVSPCPDVIDAYERLVWPAFERIHSGLFQSRNLVTIRDTLLPKLISGELRVKDATFVQSRHDVGKAEVRR